MKMSLFATRALVMMVAVLHGVPQYFRNGFFAEDFESQSDLVDIVITKGSQQIAPFVSPRMAGKAMKRDGKSLKEYKPVPVKPIYESFAEDILQTSNTAFYAADNTPEARATKALLDDLNSGVDAINRRVELMCSEFMTKGSITCKGDGVDDEIDFQRDAELTAVFTGDLLFTSEAANPIDIISDKCDLIYDKSGIRPDRVTLGKDAWRAMKKNPNFKAELDNRRIISGEINPKQLEAGVAYLGYLNEAGVDLYSYNNSYSDPKTGDKKEIFPSKGMSIASTNAGGKVAWASIADYGIVESLGGRFVGKIYVESERLSNPSRRELRFEGRPLPMFGNVDASGYWEVV